MLTLFARRRNQIIFFLVFCWIFLTIIRDSFVGKNCHSSSIHDSRSSASNIRICCLILARPKDLLIRARAVHETWGPRCDRHFFVVENFTNDNFTSDQIGFIQQLPILSAGNTSTGDRHLLQKVNVALLAVHQNYLNEFDWFVKADDDTYVIVDNLRAFLAKQNAEEPVTFGYNFKAMVRGGYHSGGASYALSRESLRRFHRGHQTPKSVACRWNGGMEDSEIAKCLRSQGVYIGNSTDEHDRELFHPLPFQDHFLGTVPDWLPSHAANAVRNHYNCCSDQTISFHYVTPVEQYHIHFLLYRIRLG